MKATLSTAAAGEFSLAKWVEKPGMTYPGRGYIEWHTLTLARARALYASGVQALVKNAITPAAPKPSARRKKKSN